MNMNEDIANSRMQIPIAITHSLNGVEGPIMSVVWLTRFKIEYR